MKSEYITPSVTLFKEDGSLDLASQEKHYQRLIDAEISGILILGSIGEFFALRMEQKKEMIRHAASVIKGKTQFLIGTGGMQQGELQELTAFAFENGADAAVVISPYYFTMNEDSLRKYYGAAAEAASGMPVYIYNFPDRTGYDISPALMLELARTYPNIRGVKDTIPGVAHTRDIVKTVKAEFPEFRVYSGFDDNFAYNILSGGNGCIGGLSNVIPEFFRNFRKALEDEDLGKVSRMQQTVNKLMDIYNVGVPFVPYIKAALYALGYIGSAESTFPLPEASEEQIGQILSILNYSGKNQ